MKARWSFGTVYRLRFGPTPVTQAATFVASAGATLNGTMNPHGLSTNIPSTTALLYSGGCHDRLRRQHPRRDHGTTRNLPITGLRRHGVYFRIVGQNAENALPQRGLILHFKTLP